jgi:hypothetical protein
MLFRQLGALAALVRLASAFLLPPAISEADTDIIKTLPFEDAIAMDGRVMEVSCPGCPVVTDIEGKMHVTETDSVLKLNFSISHDGVDQLLLNGLPIYPINPSAASFMEPLTASQMVKAEDNTWQYASTPVLGYSISVRRPVSSEQDHLDLVSVHLEIVEVADKFLSGIPTVDLKLLQTPSGQLMIGDAEIVAPSSPSSAPAQECTTILCKWRAIIADRLAQMKGWKGCGGESRPATTATEAEPKPHHGHDGGRPHHHPHHYKHGKHGGLARVLKGIAIHIFIPVLIGILCGITASLVGMFVGHIAIFTWRFFFRGSEHHARYHKCPHGKAAIKDVDEESKGFLEHQDPPPEYVEAPVDEKTAE